MNREPAGSAGADAAPEDVTAWLTAWRRGDEAAGGRVIAALYGDLHRMAGQRLRHERNRLTLQTTALVHESYLRLAGDRRLDIHDRSHFLALAAIAMRRVLVDRARERGAAKRGGEVDRVELPPDLAASDHADVEILDLDRALSRLETAYPRQARVVEMRFFGGLEESEIADVTGTSVRTVRRDWSFAAAWLGRELAARP